MGAAGALALTPSVASAAGKNRKAAETKPLALVYRGPASLPGCPEAVAQLLRDSPTGFRTEYVGPMERKKITKANLDEAVVYAQPGGPSLSTGWTAMSPHATVIREWVAGGGNYLGFCLGGYLAGATPGFGLLPGDTWQYITASDATVKTTAATRIDVQWRGATRTVFFQDGPAFWLEPGANAEVVARYQGGQPAALIAPYGAGRVGVVGPHPEADITWFSRVDPTNAIHPELGYDLIESTIRR